MKYVMRVIAVAVGLLPLTSPAARAQQMTAATVSGTVKDAQGIERVGHRAAQLTTGSAR